MRAHGKAGLKILFDFSHRELSSRCKIYATGFELKGANGIRLLCLEIHFRATA
jgi:hypothetical protein